MHAVEGKLLAKRTIAFGLDLLICYTWAAFLVFPFALFAGRDWLGYPFLVVVSLLTYLPALPFLYGVIFELTAQTTPAKALFGLAVVDWQGMAASKGLVLLRNAIKHAPAGIAVALSGIPWDWAGLGLSDLIEPLHALRLITLPEAIGWEALYLFGIWIVTAFAACFGLFIPASTFPRLTHDWISRLTIARPAAPSFPRTLSIGLLLLSLPLSLFEIRGDWSHRMKLSAPLKEIPADAIVQRIVLTKDTTINLRVGQYLSVSTQDPSRRFALLRGTITSNETGPYANYPLAPYRPALVTHLRERRLEEIFLADSVGVATVKYFLYPGRCHSLATGNKCREDQASGDPIVLTVTVAPRLSRNVFYLPPTASAP